MPQSLGVIIGTHSVFLFFFLSSLLTRFPPTRLRSLEELFWPPLKSFLWGTLFMLLSIFVDCFCCLFTFPSSMPVWMPRPTYCRRRWSYWAALSFFIVEQAKRESHSCTFSIKPLCICMYANIFIEVVRLEKSVFGLCSSSSHKCLWSA